MKLIGKLKEKVDQAESLEVKKGLIEEAGVALTDDELAQVAGGTDHPGRPSPWDYLYDGNNPLIYGEQTPGELNIGDGSL